MQALYIEKPMQGITKETDIPKSKNNEIILKVMAAGAVDFESTDRHGIKFIKRNRLYEIIRY